MNRNTEAHFSKLPNVKIQRSLFDRSTQNKLSFNAGLLIPIFVDEYLPGDTFTLDTSIVIRTASPFIKPVMDNLYADIYYFSVPNRLVWIHWKEFMGENTSSNPWVATTEYTIPTTGAPVNGWNIGTVADYMGIPTKVQGISVSSLWFRAYTLIWNEYFRDQNVQAVQVNSYNDQNDTGSNGTQLYDARKGGAPLPVNKFHDYFTSALPGPQRGNPVGIQLTTGTAPVYGSGGALSLTWGDYGENTAAYIGGLATDSNGKLTIAKTVTGTGDDPDLPGSHVPGATPLSYATTVTEQTIGIPDKTKITTNGLNGSGLVADLSGVQQVININQLREAFALQRLLEKDARGGTRYIEVIKAHFNVNSPDARLQRPEYLGGKRIPINIDQIVQMSGTESISGPQQTPQGNVSAYSLTADKSSSFTKSFTEHGMILGFICVRQEHTYQQGLNRMFSRRRRYDYYWPSLANLGETSILNKEIYAQGSSVVNPDTGVAYDNETFGFQEIWAEYRYKPSQVCGQMRSNATNSYAVYHFADNYTTRPTLSSSWMQETKDNINRTLSVTSVNNNAMHQFIADIYFTYRCARPMPTYSVPGLMDHF